MKKPVKNSEATIPDTASLRKKAEEKLRTAAVKTELTPEETKPLLHELHVHQIELEMQNEELLRAQAELETAQERYFDLFNLAPVGYITVSESTLIQEANLTAATLLGLARSALAKQPLTRFICKEDNDIYYLRHKQLFKTGEPQTCELRMVKHDGTAFWARLQATIAPDDNGARACRIVLIDISERKHTEEKIKNSLAEKEVLLKEVHHRVKNNLMTIISLIKMQEAKADNETFSALLQELEGRVRAMAQVHESLHKSKDLARVDLQDYIETMSAHIRAQYGAERAISFSLQTAGIEVNLDIAVPCGLILNELITNAFKHAFPGGQPGEIRVSFQERRGVKFYAPTDGKNTYSYELTVADNGVGLPAGVNWENPETVGLQLVKMLSQQLNGSIELDRSSGTVFSLQFPVPEKNSLPCA